jgi:tetraacyldisaccharide 4'-kinase
VRRLEAAWWADRPGWRARALLAPLLPAEALFRLGVALRGWLYDRRLLPMASAPAPVLSVGNLAVGGAGKTPVALAIARRLQARGRRVAVLSRGYGAERADDRVVSDGTGLRLGAAAGGDEPVLLARRLPGLVVLCGPRRATLVAPALSLGADALVLDDGLQHRALARDLDVVVVDAAAGLGNGHLLPAGPNREPRAALRRAGLLWLTRVDEARDPAALAAWREAARQATGREAVESRHAPVEVVDGRLERPLGLAALHGARVLLLSGVARPASFRRTVEGLGATVAAERIHPDHHVFTAADLEAALAAAAAAGCDRLVLTEKDAVRLAPAVAGDPRLCAVRIEAAVQAGEAGLEAALEEALHAGDRRRTMATP